MIPATTFRSSRVPAPVAGMRRLLREGKVLLREGKVPRVTDGAAPAAAPRVEDIVQALASGLNPATIAQDALRIRLAQDAFQGRSANGVESRSLHHEYPAAPAAPPASAAAPRLPVGWKCMPARHQVAGHPGGGGRGAAVHHW